MERVTRGEDWMMKFAILVVLAACAFVDPAWAATFYVDATAGNDTNDGLSQGTPWKTVAKVNGSTFSAGDSVLFLVERAVCVCAVGYESGNLLRQHGCDVDDERTDHLRVS